MALHHEDIVDIELESGSVHRSFLNHSIGSGDSAANRFGVRLFRGGEPEDISGASCQGFFRNSQGENIALTSYGTVSGNVAYITLPQACYNYDGQFTLAIKLIGGGVTGTMRIIDGVVDNTNTGGAVAPIGAVPTYQEVLAIYEQMEQTLDDYESVVSNQNQQITDLKSALENESLSVIKDILNVDKVTIHKTFTAGKKISSTGRVSDDTYRIATVDPIDISTAKALEYDIVSGYQCYIATYSELPANENQKVATYGWLTGTGSITLGPTEKYLKISINTTEGTTVLAPSDADKAVFSYATNYYDWHVRSLKFIEKIGVTPTDLDDLLEEGFYTFVSTNYLDLTHRPDVPAFSGVIAVIPVSNYNRKMQIIVNQNNGDTWARYLSTEWRDWYHMIDRHLETENRVVKDVVNETEQYFLAEDWELGRYTSSGDNTSSAKRIRMKTQATAPYNMIVHVDDGYTVYYYVYNTETATWSYKELATTSRYPAGTYEFSIPAGTIYKLCIRLTTEDDEDKTVDDLIGKISWHKTLNAGRINYLAMGDSLAWGRNGDDGGYTGIEKSYPGVIACIKGCNLTNGAIAGSGWVNDPPIAGRLADFNLADYDLITVSMGVNDYTGNEVLGSVSDAAGAASVCGKIKDFIETIQTANPVAKIVMIATPPYPGSSYNKTDSTKNTAVVPWSIGDLLAAEITICAEYGVQLIDLRDACCVFSNSSIFSSLLTDGTHGNTKTYARMGLEIADKMQ